jgi:hypothetical protein
MHATLGADRDLRSANGAGRDGASVDVIHGNGRGKSAAAITGPLVCQITTRRVASEVHEMHDAFAVDCRTWLNSAAWDPQRAHRWCFLLEAGLNAGGHGQEGRGRKDESVHAHLSDCARRSRCITLAGG